MEMTAASGAALKAPERTREGELLGKHTCTHAHTHTDTHTHTCTYTHTVHTKALTHAHMPTQEDGPLLQGTAARIQKGGPRKAKGSMVRQTQPGLKRSPMTITAD